MMSSSGRAIYLTMWAAIGLGFPAHAKEAPPSPASYIRIYSNGGELGCNPIMVARNENLKQSITVIFMDQYSTVDVGGTHNGEAAMDPMTFLPGQEIRIGCKVSATVGISSTNNYSILSAKY
jgi:hypothetical protein